MHSPQQLALLLQLGLHLLLLFLLVYSVLQAAVLMLGWW
jgi:hypothetical protein